MITAKDSGAVYCPNLNASSQIKNSVSYSFGTVEAKKKNPLLMMTATLASVGPNTYHPNYNALDRLPAVQNQPFAKAKRTLHSVIRNSNWDSQADYSSVSKQVSSKHRSENEVIMSKAKKTNPFVGFVENNVLRISLPHASY